MTTKPACCDHDHGNHEGNSGKKKPDFLFWVPLGVVVGAYVLHALNLHDHDSWVGRFNGAAFEIMNAMIWGMVIGIIALGFLSRVPREFVMSALGTGRGFKGILRATLAGTLFDLCSHGILMVAAKFYERGASIGQVMAFLISSPWNSISLTFILIALIGWKWTLVFIALSMLIGIVSGLVFERLVDKGVLPPNPNRTEVSPDFRFWKEARAGLARVKWGPKFFIETLYGGLIESKMILRWLFIGVIIAGVIRVVATPDALFAHYFGPTIFGLFVTLALATLVEVCSEGSAPVATDIINRAGAVGNGFTFMMAGVATDYTEIMVLREVTKSWKIPLFLPLVTVPQIIVLGYILNQFGVR